MILKARAVVTMDGPPIQNGTVAIAGDKIVEIGARHGGDVIDLGDCALMPGLINAHCHLDYTNLRGAIPPPSSFTSWVKSINAYKAQWSEDGYLRSIDAGFAEAARFGTTTLVNLEAMPQVVAKLASIPLRTWWMAEMIDVRAEVSPAQVLQLLPVPAGLAPHTPYTASAKLYRETASSDAELMTTHLAESREEMEMYAEANGPLFDFMASIGRRMDDCGSTTPLQRLLEERVLDERWIIAHLNELTAEDFALLEHGPRFHIAHCPRSHAYFGHTPFAFRKLKSLGFNICIATDSLASTPNLSLFAELRQLRKIERLPARDLLEMVTVNPASALRQEHALGRIRPGFLADLIAVPATAAGESLYDEVLAWEGPIPWVMVNGQCLTSPR